jgi:hypothetical protein
MYFAMTELGAINQKVKENGTLFGISLNPCVEGYNEDNVKEAVFKLRGILAECRMH